MKLRITKYNPYYRDKQGSYLKEEWISICDIGRYYNGALFTAEQYFTVEDAYIETIKLLLNYQKIDHLVIARHSDKKRIKSFFTFNQFFSIDKDFIKSLKCGRKCNIIEIETIMRLVLREDYWCSFTGKDHTYLDFGYDYYMYYGCDSHIKLEEINFPNCIYIENNFQSPDL